MSATPFAPDLEAQHRGLERAAYDDIYAVDERVVVTHLHDNDGTAGDHDPLPPFESVVETIDARYNALEMKSLVDVETRVAT
jgi:hypothetical protein